MCGMKVVVINCDDEGNVDLIDLKNKVIKLGEKNSRLTGGRNIHLPIKYYSVTYLYREKHNLKMYFDEKLCYLKKWVKEL